MSIQVSIIIVTYNSASTIAECLLSLNRQVYSSFEAILVDNNSCDNTRDIVESMRGDLQFPLNTFYLKENLGFTGGNIRGIKETIAPMTALLNPDAFAEPQWLCELVEAMNAEPDRGICASKMLLYGGNVIDSAGDGFMAWLKGFKRGEGEDEKEYGKSSYVFGACAGAALYRKEMIDEIGFLDEDLFLMHEDSDLNFRAQMAGWKVYYVSTAVVRHKVRSSIGDMSDIAIYYSLRNIELVRIKNVPAAILFRHIVHLLVYIFVEFIYFVLRHGKLILYLRAKISVLKMMSQTLKKRSKALSLQRVSNKQISSMFTPLFEIRSFAAKARKVFYG